MEIELNQKTTRWEDHECMLLIGLPNGANCKLRLFPRPVISDIAANKWPSQIVAEKIPLEPVATSGYKWIDSAVIHLQVSMISDSFVRYFEGNKHLARSRFGGDTQSWPSVWNFGRVIRNALSHNGAIRFDNLKALPVSWRSLSYDPSHNGRQILFKDITAVELIILMEEMDSLL